ncbi:glycosyltransferase family 2 protein [Actinoalloteichus hymeniacidonis]|uniref:Glycosyltransferase n=1 Tax=Actinoalloteichus hymeniacidonis TaxID=340345 RepID=A0AAC9HSB5_9PSEU|nr:glycosyltransferase family A protein [Actinoalloteichus hymeniacidonis]AOS64702.1 putative glycosyltransferase [Actinoalloteichus hymeniacidonis]MBB5907222.1 GT2 family glycosyltransferase [Actinoalloteichus hymeniacidonis]
MSEPRTTVVIATRNRAGELRHTLARLRALRPTPPIIVVDNASTDATAAAVAEVAGVRLIRLPANRAAAARNLGVVAATTPYVAFSDDDSWWAADALPAAERLLDAHPSVGLLAARTLVGPGDTEDPINTLLATSPLGHQSELPGPSVLGFLACAAIVRRTAFLRVNGFSRLLHFGAEERLLALDLAADGWDLCYAAELRAHHHPSTNRPPSAWRKDLERRNNTLIAWMRRPLPRVAAETRLLLREGDRRQRSRIVAGLLRRLPSALWQRHRLPAEVERRVRVLERAEERSRQPWAATASPS